MIGCNLLDDPVWSSDYITAYQVKIKYMLHMDIIGMMDSILKTIVAMLI